MSKVDKARAGDRPLLNRLSDLGSRIDWMMLFPVLTACAWLLGQDAVAMVLVVILPAFLALQGRQRDAYLRHVADIVDGRPLQKSSLHMTIDDVLVDCARRDRTTAVMQIQIEDLPVTDGDWGSDVAQTLMDRVTQRIAAVMRGQDRIIRSGDACVTVVLNPTRRTDLDVVMNIVDRVQIAIAEPISVDGRALRVRSRIGICSEAMAPSRSGAALLAAADCALRVAMRHGDDAVRVFNQDMQTQVEFDHKLATQIDDALDTGQIRPWFQPQVHTVTGHITGFEALARWHHPELGLLLPDRFLPCVQSAGRIVDMGDVILRQSLKALVAWDQAGLSVPSVGINLSLEELSDPRLAEQLIWQVDHHNIAPSRIAIEILETVTLRDGDETVMRNIEQMRKAGFRLDLDDFGTGAASISHIARFGVHRIKLDRSFVRGIDTDEAKRRMVAAIRCLADALDVIILAEGVETEAERETLAALGCQQLQGFIVARPMPFDDTIPWALARRHATTKDPRDRQARGSV
ncbi:EAL domain-containing protein [Jannaschia sp. 2305UL9-9]|uniref:EAL domain-containing protein n=1 Tax=Jannaschia sp. 2305UL9-9 TaxID=3121638 RepID=UPI0035296C4E